METVVVVGVVTAMLLMIASLPLALREDEQYDALATALFATAIFLLGVAGLVGLFVYSQ